jgi:hypothetical protein
LAYDYIPNLPQKGIEHPQVFFNGF